MSPNLGTSVFLREVDLPFNYIIIMVKLLFLVKVVLFWFGTNSSGEKRTDLSVNIH